MADKKEKTIAELKNELNKVKLAVRAGTEQDVSKVKKLKKQIARLLTKKNNN